MYSYLYDYLSEEYCQQNSTLPYIVIFCLNFKIFEDTLKVLKTYLLIRF